MRPFALPLRLALVALLAPAFAGCLDAPGAAPAAGADDVTNLVPPDDLPVELPPLEPEPEPAPEPQRKDDEPQGPAPSASFAPHAPMEAGNDERTTLPAPLRAQGTVSLFFAPPSGTTAGTLLSLDGECGRPVVHLRQGETLTFWWSDAPGSASCEPAMLLSAVSMERGRWTHVAYTWNASAGASIYVDGAFVAGGGLPPALDDAAEVPIRVGGLPCGGLLQDVRVYDEALDAADVARLAEARRSLAPPQTVCVPEEPHEPEPAETNGTIEADAKPEAREYGHWPLDAEQDGVPGEFAFADVSGQSTYGKKVGAPTLVPGVHGEAYALDGGTQALYLPFTGGSLPAEAMLSFRVRLEEGTMNQTLVSTMGGCANVWLMHLPNGSLMLRWVPECDALSPERVTFTQPGVLPVGEWAMVNLQWRPGDVWVHVDGQPGVAHLSDGRTPAAAGHLVLGGVLDADYQPAYTMMRGALDDVRMSAVPRSG